MRSHPADQAGVRPNVTCIVRYTRARQMQPGALFGAATRLMIV
jgi:hypothetical protein